MDDGILESLTAAVAAWDPRAIARAISILERGGPAASALRDRLHAGTGRAYLVGITGPPGSGKSTLVDRLVETWRARGLRIGVLAVDPSSPSSGGAILGDRVRMQRHATDPGVYIRSMATRGRLGGLAAATADAASVLDVAGCDVVVIETAGVGQAEVEVVRVADVVVLTLGPETGDDVQALKAGVMEVADVYVVNKSDRPGADRAVAAVESALALADGPAARRPPVLSTAATSGEGIDALIVALDGLRADQDRMAELRRQAAGWRLREIVTEDQTPAWDHAAIVASDTTDLAEKLEAWFGLSVGPAEVMESEHVSVRFVEGGRTRLELIEPTGAASPVTTFLARRGSGLHHVALRVEDLDARLADLRARGVRLVDERPRPGAGGTRVAFVHPAATGGVLIELVEAPRGHDAPGRR